MIVLVILQKLKIVPDKSIARQTKEKGDSLREYSVLEASSKTQMKRGEKTTKDEK